MRFLVFVSFLIFVLFFAHWSHRAAQEQMGTRMFEGVAKALQLDQAGVPNDPRFREIRFEVSHLDVILSGRVARKEARDELVKRIREEIPMGRIRDERVMLLMSEQPVLVAKMVPGKATLEGRVPTEDLARRLRGVFQKLGVFVTAPDLKVDKNVNLEDWLDQSPLILERFFQGAEEGEFALRDGVLHVKRGVEKSIDIDFLKAEVEEWLPQDRFKVESELFIAEAERPVELSFRKIGSNWIVNGQVPDRPALDSMVQAIEEGDASATVDVSSVSVDDSLTRPKWMQNGRIERFLKIFVRSIRSNQQLTIRPDEVIIKGTARNAIAKSNLTLGAAEAFGYAANLNDDGIRLAANDPGEEEQWLRFDLTRERVVVDGAVRDERIKKDLGTKMKQAYPEAELKDERLLVDPSLPNMPWLQRLGPLFQDLAELTVQGGTVEFSGNEAFLGGTAKTEWSRHALVDKLESILGSDFLVYDQLRADPRAGSSSSEATKIYFGLGSRKVGNDQESKIAAVADRISRSSQSASKRVLIKGFASPGGSTDYNIRLSRDRAVAVHDALVREGVKPNSISIKSEGVDARLTGEEARRVEIYVR